MRLLLFPDCRRRIIRHLDHAVVALNKAASSASQCESARLRTTSSTSSHSSPMRRTICRGGGNQRATALRPRDRASPRCQVDRAQSMDGEVSGHTEHTGSLSIRDGHSGPLVHCFGGCPQRDVIAALQDLGLWPRYDREEDGEEARRKRQERDRKAAAARLDDGPGARQGRPVTFYGPRIFFARASPRRLRPLSAFT